LQGLSLFGSIGLFPSLPIVSGIIGRNLADVMADVKTHIMNVIITPVPSKSTGKIHYTLEWGKGPGERKSTGIYTYAKPRNQIEKDHNKEALSILETKRSRMVLDLQSVGSGHIPQHKIKANFLDFYQQYVTDNQMEGNRSLACSLSSFKKFIKKSNISAVEMTENLCERFRNYLFANLNGETPADYFRRFKKMMKTAKKQGYFFENPAADIQAKAHPTGVKDVLDLKDYKILLDSYCPNFEVKKAAVCSLYTGFRWVDAKELRWWQIREKTIVLRKQSKTGVPLEVPLHPVVALIIGERKGDNDLVFDLPTYNGARKSVGIWINDNAKIRKHITWHCFRHTVSDILQDRGTHVMTVAALLGQTTAKYLLLNYQKRVRVRNIEDAMKNLPTLLEEGEDQPFIQV
jgi:integrase/recombinase XerD